MKRNQTLHETLIPMLAEGIGAHTYLELGSHENETIGKVRCPVRIGVDTHPLIVPGITFFAMDTAEFIQKHARDLAPFDFCFIDADHSYKSVRRDFFGILDLMSPDGVIAMHDTNPELEADTLPGFCGDSWRFARQLFEDCFEAMTLPYHPGLTLVRVRHRWGPK